MYRNSKQDNKRKDNFKVIKDTNVFRKTNSKNIAKSQLYERQGKTQKIYNS